MRRFACLIFTAALMSVVPARASESLRADLEAIFDDPLLEGAFLGALVRSVDKPDETLFERNAGKRFVPASNVKLFVTATALDRLGPDFRFETRLLSTDADLSDGALDGSLIVEGAGDPSFSHRFQKTDSALEPLDKWARTLAGLGAREIRGDIVGDDDLFDDIEIAEGWDASGLDAWYSAPSSALALNDNCMDVSVWPARAAGLLPRVEIFPPGPYCEPRVARASKNGANGARMRVWRELGTDILRVEGPAAPGAPVFKRSVAVRNPTLFFVVQFEAALERAGIRVAGGARDIDDMDKSRFDDRGGMTTVATYVSPPLAEIVTATNKKSQNLFADMLLKRLGVRAGQTPGSFDSGAAVVAEFLDEQGVDTSGFRLADGSGLSRLNLATPRQMVDLLGVMRRHACFEIFRKSLPAPGADGSLSERMNGSDASGNLRAKTGHLKGMAAISGYVSSRDGELLAFSFMVNHHAAQESAMDRVMDRACMRLALFSRKAR